jgi:hypothetical protein
MQGGGGSGKKRMKQGNAEILRRFIPPLLSITASAQPLRMAALSAKGPMRLKPGTKSITFRNIPGIPPPSSIMPNPCVICHGALEAVYLPFAWFNG